MTIALCYPGELGVVLGRWLLSAGHHVVVHLVGRSEATSQRAGAAGFAAARTLREAVAGADVVLSVVPPGAAREVLDTVVGALAGSGRAPLYIDANSISPTTAKELEDRCTAAGLPMVDLTVQGQAAGLPQRGNLFFSGPRAEEAARLFGPGAPSRVVGPKVGDASRFKMLLSALYKSQAALFLEACANAQRAGMLPAYFETVREFYPGMVEAVLRVLPSYPQHAPRRAEELREVETMLASEMEVRPGMVREARLLLEKLAATSTCRHPEGVRGKDSLGLVTALVKELYLA